MTWSPRWNKARRKRWPEHMAKNYYQLHATLTHLYQLSDWLRNGAIAIEFHETAITLCYEMMEFNEELWEAKGPTVRWGNYVRDVMVAIDDKAPEIMKAFRWAAQSQNSERDRYLGRAFNAIAHIRFAMREVNPPQGVGELEYQVTPLNEWFEELQLKEFPEG